MKNAFYYVYVNSILEKQFLERFRENTFCEIQLIEVAKNLIEYDFFSDYLISRVLLAPLIEQLKSLFQV